MRFLGMFVLCAAVLVVGLFAGGILAVKGKTNNIALMVDANNVVLPWPAKGDKVTWYNVNGTPEADGSTPLADIKFDKGTASPCKNDVNPCIINVPRSRRLYSCTPCGDPTIPIGSTTGTSFHGGNSEEYNTESYSGSIAHTFYSLIDNFVSPPESSHSIVAGTAQVAGATAEVSVTCGSNKVISASLTPGMPLSPGVKVVWSDVNGDFKDFKVADATVPGDATLSSACEASVGPPYVLNPRSGTTSTACKLTAAGTVAYTITSTSCGTSPTPFVLPVPAASLPFNPATAVLSREATEALKP